VRRVVALLLGIVALGLAVTCAVVVDETEHVVITQFGRPVAVHSEAGLYAKLPAPVQRVARVERRTLFTELRETELLTADKKNVLVQAFLSWRVADPLQFLTSLRTREFADARLGALVQSELGSALGDLPFAELVPAGGEGPGVAGLEESVLGACREAARRDFGIDVVTLGVTRLGYPPQNEQSVFARMRAERERIARGFRSEGRAEAQKIRAEADRRRAEILAEAESEAARLRGEGEAGAARITAESVGGQESFYRFLRTLEATERVLNEKTTLVLPADSPFLELLERRPDAAGGTAR
jgi:membrane protease subunit HflC